MASAVVVDQVSKRYRLYRERNQSLKASLMRRGRARYEEFWALRDVSLDVAAGTTYGLVGENGSGKSTLLKCMARILRPDSGRIEVEGKVSALLELGAGFHPELSGRENVYLNGSILGMGKRELQRKFDGIVDFAGLEQFIDTPVKNYSSGMYVRLGFSVAISVDPDVLLVDEILAVGDEAFQRKCLEKVAELKADGRTIVIVSHALESVRSLCDEAAWLEHGVIKDVGPTGRIVDQYYDKAHTEREVGHDDEARWGAGGAWIDHVELVGPDGAPTRRVRTGDAVRFRLQYRCDDPVARPVFGLALYTVNGVHVTGPNTKDGGTELGRIEGTGRVDLVIDHLMLLPGTYDVTAVLCDQTLVHEFDHRHRVLRFDVEAGEPAERAGVVSLGGQWDVQP